jgi:hypothetical protein
VNFANEMNSQLNRWTEAAKARLESAALQAARGVRRGLRAAASGVNQATIVTEKFATVGAEFSTIMFRGSRELAACNLGLSRELLVTARKRLECAATAETLADAWRGQARSWPATRARLSLSLRKYQNTFGKTYSELKRSAIGALAASSAGKSQAAPQRRRRTARKRRAAA